MISVSAFFSYPSRSQQKDLYSHASLAEKIYLQLDGKVYNTDQTIWFKSIVTHAIAFTMMVGPMHPVAERLYFNERTESRINIEISADKDVYTQRELTKLDIKTTNNASEAVSTNLVIL